MREPASTSDHPNELRWKIAAASVVGTGHIRTGLPCQDSTRFRYLDIPDTPADTLVAAVADGAGSAPHSDEGSSLATVASISSIVHSLERRPAAVDADNLHDILAESMLTAHRAVNNLAEANGHRPRDYHTTLLVAVHVDGLLGAAQIGDGAAVASGDDGDFRLINSPERGEYANETSFVTQPESVENAQITVIPDCHANSIAMFSDGIQNLVLDYRDRTDPIPHAPFFRGVFSWLEQQPDELSAYTGLRRFLKSPRVNARTNDDVSLLLARLMPA